MTFLPINFMLSEAMKTTVKIMKDKKLNKINYFKFMWNNGYLFEKNDNVMMLLYNNNLFLHLEAKIINAKYFTLLIEL